MLLTGAPEGSWGLGGHANTNAELVSAAGGYGASRLVHKGPAILRAMILRESGSQLRRSRKYRLAVISGGHDAFYGQSTTLDVP